MYNDCVFSSYHMGVYSKSTLRDCLNVKELFAWNWRTIRKLSDYNWNRTHNHLACKQTLNNECLR